ncbi:single-stranded DNA-binding protein [Streptomyces sp. NPDC059070]|uniref:single-stranded DNA-binding protein n=1 Tax=Streptomyces sp. NPDC059070 TaxID=3346713 RepID=UPI00369FBCD2
MAGETLVTVVGNLTADPELRHTASGLPVASFTIASTPRTYQRENGAWEDGETLFLRCTLWRQTAQNAQASLRRGMRVIVTGRLRQRSFDDAEGQHRTTAEIDAEDIALSLTHAAAQVTKTHRPANATAPAAASTTRPAQEGARHPFRHTPPTHAALPRRSLRPRASGGRPGR